MRYPADRGEGLAGIVGETADSGDQGRSQMPGPFETLSLVEHAAPMIGEPVHTSGLASADASASS